MWLKHVNWNAPKQLCPKSLLEVGYWAILRVKAVHTPVYHYTGLKVVEVAHAHDMQLAVGRYVKQDLKLLNSFDTWHGMV